MADMLILAFPSLTHMQLFRISIMFPLGTATDNMAEMSYQHYWGFLLWFCGPPKNERSDSHRKGFGFSLGMICDHLCAWKFVVHKVDLNIWMNKCIWLHNISSSSGGRVRTQYTAESASFKIAKKKKRVVCWMTSKIFLDHMLFLNLKIYDWMEKMFKGLINGWSQTVTYK